MTKKKRGLAFAAAGYPVVGIALLFSFIMLLFIFKFYSAYEVSVTDRIFTGISASNHFVMMKNNMETYVPFVVMTTAYELGQEGGGLGDFWISSEPELDPLKDRYMESLRGKFGFPQKVGPFSRLLAEIPDHDLVYGSAGSRDNKVEILVEEDNVKVSMFPYGFESDENVNSFDFSAGVETEGVVPPEFEKGIRYIRMLELMRNFFDEGIYIRDASKVTFKSGTAVCFDTVASITCKKTVDLSGKTAGYFLGTYVGPTSCHTSTKGFDYCILTDEVEFNIQSANNLDAVCEPKGSVKTGVEGGTEFYMYGGRYNSGIDYADVAVSAGIPAEDYYGEIKTDNNGIPLIYIPIETMLKTAILCGYGTEDGLGGIDNFKGDLHISKNFDTMLELEEYLDEGECSEENSREETDWTDLEPSMERLSDEMEKHFTEFYIGGKPENEGLEISIAPIEPEAIPQKISYIDERFDKLSDLDSKFSGDDEPNDDFYDDQKSSIIQGMKDCFEYYEGENADNLNAQYRTIDSFTSSYCKNPYENSVFCWGGAFEGQNNIYCTEDEHGYCYDNKALRIAHDWGIGWYKEEKDIFHKRGYCKSYTEGEPPTTHYRRDYEISWEYECSYLAWFKFDFNPRFSISLKDNTVLVPEKDSGMAGTLNPLELKIRTGLNVKNIASEEHSTPLDPGVKEGE